MQRIPALLQKITELSNLKDKAGVIEIDLMMDYTKVIYADLLEWRNRVAFSNSVAIEKTVTDVNPPAIERTVINIPVTVQPENKDIRRLVGINDKYLFISELFGNDKDAYEAIMDELNNLETHQQAVNWLNAKMHWDDEQETVQSFYGLLSNFFSAK